MRRRVLFRTCVSLLTAGYAAFNSAFAALFWLAWFLNHNRVLSKVGTAQRMQAKSTGQAAKAASMVWAKEVLVRLR